MDTVSITLPESLKKFVEARVSARGVSVGDYLRELIEIDRTRAAREALEAELLKGLDGDAVEMTRTEWDSLRDEVNVAPDRAARGVVDRSGRRVSATSRSAAREANT